MPKWEANVPSAGEKNPRCRFGVDPATSDSAEPIASRGDAGSPQSDRLREAGVVFTEKRRVRTHFPVRGKFPFSLWPIPDFAQIIPVSTANGKWLRSTCICLEC